jgi:O-antigen/teichoic acid export membrane protein
MSRIRNAALTSAFGYAQHALSLASGFVLFPLVVWHLGARDYGLWLASGELAGYLLLGDLGVFTVLPLLVAGRDGAGDRPGIARHLADALAVGVAVAAGLGATAAAVWWGGPDRLGVNPADWAKVRGPLALLLVLTGIGLPLRAFTALLVGLQDVAFVGAVSLAQAALGVALTATLIPLGYGMPGLAVAAGLPPLLTGLAATARAFTRHRDVTRRWYRPAAGGCRRLLREGFGSWLSGFGVRLLTASSNLVFAALGRPEWGTMYTATGKLVQAIQPACWVIPDSSLVGLGQLAGADDLDRTRRTVLCLLMLYLLIPGGAAVAVMLANPWFVRVWPGVGPGLYAGDSVSALIAVNLVIGSAISGLFKVVGVVGYRVRLGVATIAYGAVAAGLGYLLGREHGMAGLAGGVVIAGVVLAIPVGLYVVWAVYRLGPRDLLGGGVGWWAVVTAPLLSVAAWLGGVLAGGPAAAVAAAGAVFAAAYLVALRPVVAGVPWPDRVRKWMLRLRLIPRVPTPGPAAGGSAGGKP